MLFGNQQKFINGSVVHPSLHSNCHNQIIYGKIIFLKIFYPLSYEYANADMISKANEDFDEDKAFSEKSVDVHSHKSYSFY